MPGDLHTLGTQKSHCFLKETFKGCNQPAKNIAVLLPILLLPMFPAAGNMCCRKHLLQETSAAGNICCRKHLLQETCKPPSEQKACKDAQSVQNKVCKTKCAKQSVPRTQARERRPENAGQRRPMNDQSDSHEDIDMTTPLRPPNSAPPTAPPTNASTLGPNHSPSLNGPALTRPTLESLTNSMNPPQKEAVDILEGPLLILAGAGSGKTRVLTFRTANLIAKGLASPDEILAVTFTNKAAREMENRILGLLKQVGVAVHGRMWISTFHSICARILREHIHLLDYKPFFGIYDTSDQLSMIKKVLVALNIDDKTHPAKSFAARINAAKTDALAPEDIKRKRHIMDERSLAVYSK
jgi:hypothetical protein